MHINSLNYDVDSFRNNFTSLQSDIAHFDGPGGSQVPDIVGKSVADTLCSSISNRGTITAPEKNADAVVTEFRNAVSDFLDASPEGIVFGRSWTALAYDFARSISKTWNKDDEIIVTRLDHDSNIRPWLQAAASTGVTVKWVDFDKISGELLPEELEKVLSPKTKLVAMTGASNIIGTRPDIEKMIRLTHQYNALFILDAVHLAPHASISLKNLDADIIGCSPYKFMGPHCGILAAKPSLLETLQNDKLLPSTNQIPERFELGTLPYELMSGVTTAINFIADLQLKFDLDRKNRIKNALESIEAYEAGLFQYLLTGIKEMKNIEIFGNSQKRTPTLYFRIQGKEPKYIHQFLASKNISAPAGNFYALEASRWLGLGDEGAVRVGLAPYNKKSEIDRLLKSLKEIC